MYLYHIAIAVVFFVFCLLQGAYFPSQYTAAFVLLIAGYVIKHKFEFNKSLILFLLMLVPIIMSAVFKSDSVYNSVTEIIKYSLIPISYGFYISLDDKEQLIKYIYIALITLGALGVLVYFNIVSVYDGMTSPDHGYRLQSVWQNANTNALFMAIGIMLSLHYIINKKKIYCIIPLMIFVFDFYVARSRTTMLILFAIIFVYLLWEINNRVTKIIAISSVILVIAIIVFAGGRIVQISLSEPTLVERIVVVKDAISYVKDNIMLGMGVGNWKNMQYEIQTTRYAVKYVHCFPVQLMLDGGVFAALFYISGIAVGLKFIKKNNINACIVMLIFLHSLLDFTMNYGVSIIIMMLFLSCCTSNDEKE